MRSIRLLSPSAGKKIIVGAAFAVALAGCGRRAETPDSTGTGSGGKSLTKIILQTDWYAQPEHGGFYQALVKGYYREAGLDVEIRPGNPATHPQQVVAIGQADFGIGRSEDVIVFASRGIPLVMIGALMQRDPQAIMFHRESGIRSFKDLDGRTVMAVPGSTFIPILERTFQIKLAIVPSDYGMVRFLTDKQWVQQCFITNEPYYVRKQGADVVVLPLSDAGIAPYRVWYTTRKFAAEHPEAVRAFTAASIRGWRDYFEGDHTAANAQVGALNPKLDSEFMEFSIQAMRDYHLVAGDPARGEAIGQIRRERVQEEISRLAGIGVLDKPVTVDDVFLPQFLPDDVKAPAGSK